MLKPLERWYIVLSAKIGDNTGVPRNQQERSFIRDTKSRFGGRKKAAVIGRAGRK